MNWKKKSARDRFNAFLLDRKKLTHVQFLLGFGLALGGILTARFASDSNLEATINGGLTIAVTALMFFINLKVIAPLNVSSFAKTVYDFEKKHPGQVSASTIRFLENLDSREDQYVSRALRFIFFDTMILSLNDYEHRSKSNAVNAFILWFDKPAFFGGMFNTEREIESLMEMGLIQYSILPRQFPKMFDIKDPLILYRVNYLLRISPSTPQTFKLYIATQKAKELILASEKFLNDSTVDVLIATQLKDSGTVERFEEPRQIGGQIQGFQVRIVQPMQ